MKLTSANEAENKAAVEQIKQIAGRLDVVIANAGVATDWALAAEDDEDIWWSNFVGVANLRLQLY